MSLHFGGNVFLRATAAAAIVVLSGAGLAACTTPSPDPAPTQSSQSPEPTPGASETPSTAGPASVVTIAAADVDGATVTVAGYVTQISEEGGSCTFALTSALDGSVVEAPSTAAANVATTSCGTVQVPVAELAKGTWSVVLHYTSDSWDLTSEPVTMEVP